MAQCRTLRRLKTKSIKSCCFKACDADAVSLSVLPTMSFSKSRTFKWTAGQCHYKVKTSFRSAWTGRYLRHSHGVQHADGGLDCAGLHVLFRHLTDHHRLWGPRGGQP